jgi:hypothetical protein
MFDSSACHAYGFGKSVYTAHSMGKAITFQVRATSKDKSKETWNGTVEGNNIHGTVKMTDPQGKVKNYTFKGMKATT